MYTNNALPMILSAISGGFISAFIVYAAIKHITDINRKVFESFWNYDLKRLNEKIDNLTNDCITRNVLLHHKLSPKAVNKAVDKCVNYSHNKPYC